MNSFFLPRFLCAVFIGRIFAMYGPLLSVLLMGMIPVWGLSDQTQSLSRELSVAPPALSASGRTTLQSLASSLSASGVIIADLESGQIVFERNATVSRPMASLTKLMTALIIVENHSMKEIVTVPQDILNTIGNDREHLPPGDQFTVGDLLSAMLIISSNDAAVTLARFHSGTVSKFAEEMNSRATSLGLKNTSYNNPIGLDAPQQNSTPQDLAWLSMYVYRYPEISKRMATPDAQIKSVNGRVMLLTHTNELLHEDSFVIAGKTGTTDGAGQCLLSIVKEGGHRYVVVLLRSRDRYADMRRILSSLHTVIAAR